MGVDVLVLNTAVVDLRRPDFQFVDNLVMADGLAKCESRQMPRFSSEDYQRWIEEGCATAGGFGNNAALMAATGINIAAFTSLGQGNYPTSDGTLSLDAQGAFFYDKMLECGVDMSRIQVNPRRTTGTTFIHAGGAGGRGGIAYFPGANHDMDFQVAKEVVQLLDPKIVYYMYSGLSDKGDANGGQDLAEFLRWCGPERITIVDCHTLTGNPSQVIASGKEVREYNILNPVLRESNIFFTSSDEAGMIGNTLKGLPSCRGVSDEYCGKFAAALRAHYGPTERGTLLFGVTVKDGAFFTYETPRDVKPVRKISSNFMAGENIDLVGAGDAFRAGVLSYVSRHIDEWFAGSIDFSKAVQMGNLFAAVFIKSPLDNRYCNIGTYDMMESIVNGNKRYDSFERLLRDIRG